MPFVLNKELARIYGDRKEGVPILVGTPLLVW
ncbi:hypothetical protein B23_1000 [Geobacillus thermoleovorans B23]|nr:hypothetical protein B23_1000 [Geobacillus thermoleovorans B23]